MYIDEAMYVSRPHSSYIVRVLYIMALLSILCVLFLTRLGDLGNYHGDESLWLTVSTKLFRLYAFEHQFDDPAWHQEYSTFGSRQPQIGKYLIGLGTTTVDFKGEPAPYVWQWDQSQTWNLAHHVPPPEVVLRGRFPIALMGIIASLSFYWLVTLVVNPWCGLIALASLLGARLLIESSQRAMIDSPALAFGLLTLVGMVYLLRALRDDCWWPAVRWAILTGFVSGLAIGTKLHALLILVVCVTSLASEAAIALHTDRRKVYVVLMCMLIILAGAWTVFYLSNPVLYHAPLEGVRHMLELNSIVSAIPFQPLHTIPERMLAIWNSMYIYAPLTKLGLPYDRWLIFLGIIAVAITARRGATHLRTRQYDLILLWLLISYAGITLWLPHDWDRYYLPLQPCNAFLQAYGLWWLGTQLVAARQPEGVLV